MFASFLAGTLSLLPQLALHQRVAVPVIAQRLAVSPQAALTTDEKIVPRDVLFGNPEYASPMLSPDGKLLAYLRPDEGVMNVWCRTVGQADDRVVTSDKYRGIRQAFWAEDSKTLLFMQDDAGDENFHLFAIDATSSSSAARDLTPFKGAKAQNVITNKRYPDQVSALHSLHILYLPPQVFTATHTALTSATTKLPFSLRALSLPASCGHQQRRPGQIRYVPVRGGKRRADSRHGEPGRRAGLGHRGRVVRGARGGGDEPRRLVHHRARARQRSGRVARSRRLPVRAAWSKCPPSLAVPQLGSCASSGRAWRLWAARHSQSGEAQPLWASSHGLRCSS